MEKHCATYEYLDIYFQMFTSKNFVLPPHVPCPFGATLMGFFLMILVSIAPFYSHFRALCVQFLSNIKTPPLRFIGIFYVISLAFTYFPFS